MSNRLRTISLAAFGLAFSCPVLADNPFHMAPYDFLSGNHIDTHQENNLTVNRTMGAPESLIGNFYIILQAMLHKFSASGNLVW